MTLERRESWCIFVGEVGSATLARSAYQSRIAGPPCVSLAPERGRIHREPGLPASRMAAQRLHHRIAGWAVRESQVYTPFVAPLIVGAAPSCLAATLVVIAHHRSKHQSGWIVGASALVVPKSVWRHYMLCALSSCMHPRHGCGSSVGDASWARQRAMPWRKGSTCVPACCWLPAIGVFSRLGSLALQLYPTSSGKCTFISDLLGEWRVKHEKSSRGGAPPLPGMTPRCMPHRYRTPHEWPIERNIGLAHYDLLLCMIVCSTTTIIKLSRLTSPSTCHHVPNSIDALSNPLFAYQHALLKKYTASETVDTSLKDYC
nr:hypothetical protein CFP56_63774 [Quercus suber]